MSSNNIKPSTSISWCHHTLNLQKWHCIPTSAGCKNCYALAMAKRFPDRASDKPELADNMQARTKKLAAFKPGSWVFLADMYDYLLYVDSIQTPVEFAMLHHVLPMLRPDVNFMLLTKHPNIASMYHLKLIWPDNLWFGVTVDNKKELKKLDFLKRERDAKHKFVSFEPLLEDVSGGLNLTGIDFAIVGGESGAKRRPFDKQWARNIQRVCDRDGVVFHFKQGNASEPGQDFMLGNQQYRPLPDGTTRLDCRDGAIGIAKSAQLRIFEEAESEPYT